jgi:hypothetical protein
LQDGRQIAPFQIAPWANELLTAEAPGVLKRLRGRWTGVPYGSDIDRSAMDGWPASQAKRAVDTDSHGFGSNHLWRFEEVSGNTISVAIDHPATHPFRRLERRVHVVSDRAAIDFELGFEARHDCRIAIGLHPCFRLPTMPGVMQIELPPSASSMSYPGAFDQSSLIAPGQFAPQ